MSRWKAATIHLAISAGVAAIAASLLFGLWYPHPYFQATGGDRLLYLLAGIDLVLGPLLTLIVFRHGKPSLRFDLSVIALMQATALGYGLYVMSQARPVYLVGAVDRFVLVAANDFDSNDLAAAPRYRRLSWMGPRLVAARAPTSGKERNELLFDALEGKDIQLQPRYYVEYPLRAQELVRRAQTFSGLVARNPESAPMLARWLSDSGYAPADLVWLPLVARDSDLVLVLRRSDGQPVGALPIDPW